MVFLQPRTQNCGLAALVIFYSFFRKYTVNKMREAMFKVNVTQAGFGGAKFF